MVHSEVQKENNKQNGLPIFVILVLAGISSFLLTFWLASKVILPVMPFEDGGFVLYYMLMLVILFCVYYGIYYGGRRFMKNVSSFISTCQFTLGLAAVGLLVLFTEGQPILPLIVAYILGVMVAPPPIGQ